MKLHVEPKDLELVRDILQNYLPDFDVWAFGSRVHGENLKPFSDLDLVVITEQPLDSLLFAELKDAFADSPLPFKVDLLDWSTTNESFRQLINKEHQIIQYGNLTENHAKK